MSKDQNDLGNSLDLPFEPTSGPLLDEHVHLAGGAVVMAAAVPVDGAGVKPALVFRFATPDGHFYPATVLVADPDQLRNLIPLVTAAVDAAITGAAR